MRKLGSTPLVESMPQTQAGDVNESHHRELMQAIDDILRRLDAAAGTAVPTALTQPSAQTKCAEPSAPGVPRMASCGLDCTKLLTEFRALETAIAETKQEIAALRALGEPPDSLTTATNELDAVVQATESATESILAASERIDELVVRLRNQAADAEERAGIDEIGEQVTRIFESCNFQDITGQRITKVVNAMKFIEDRVERMIEILGGSQAFAGLVPDAPPPPSHAAEDEAELLSGPQLDQHKISQDAIDAFFD
jgi:chemotaxis protein CheZ